MATPKPLPSLVACRVIKGATRATTLNSRPSLARMVLRLIKSISFVLSFEAEGGVRWMDSSGVELRPGKELTGSKELELGREKERWSKGLRSDL